MSRLSYPLSALALVVGLTGCVVEPSDTEIESAPYYEVVQSSPNHMVITGFVGAGQSLLYTVQPPSNTANFRVTLTAENNLDLAVAIGASETVSASESGSEEVTGVSASFSGDLDSEILANESSYFVLDIVFEGIGTSPGFPL